MKLNEALKFAEERKNRQTAGNASRPLANKSSGKKHISPELARGLAMSSAPILTKGLENLIADGDSLDLSEMISLDGMLGTAAQFLPPWAGDALAVANSLASGDVAGAVDAMLSKYLPPELKAVYDAIKNVPGGWKEFLKWLMENPKEPQGADGLWAARLSDIVVCPGGVGPIIAPCLPTVLIGGMPAARRGDIALCNGLPIDSIVVGEPTVWMGGNAMFAARREDDTAHGGKITTGFPTVHIGKKRGISDMSIADGCLKKAADAGAATISGSGITNPLGEGAFGGLGDVFKDVAKNKLAEFASQKALEVVSDLIGADKDKVSDGDNYQNYGSHSAEEKDSKKPPPISKPNKSDAPKAIPKPQPFIF